MKPDDPKKSFADAVYAGLALFFSMYYVLGLNPEILKDIGMPVSGTLLGCFLIIILGNITGTIRTDTGLMIAPAVGISAFVASFVKTSDSHADWRYAMFGCLVAGLAVLITSVLTDWRSQIVEQLPVSVRKAATAGIGALLVSKAFDLLKEAEEQQHHLDPHLGKGLIALGVITLIVFSFLRKKFLDNPENDGPLGLVLRIDFALVVVVMTIFLHLLQQEYINNLPAKTELTFIWWDKTVWLGPWHPTPDKLILSLVVLPSIIWFIIMSDVPGTPSVVLPEELQKKDGGRAAKSGYTNDGLFALLAPVFGITPPIYYAENQILKYMKIYDRRVGWVATGMFSLLFIIVLLLKFFPSDFSYWNLPTSIERLIPTVAVLPVLIFVGLYIISISFSASSDGDDLPESGSEEPSSKSFTPEYFFPAAISVILTERMGLEYAFPFAILSYWLVRDDDAPVGSTFKAISWGSLAVLFVFAIFFLFSSGAAEISH